VDQIHAKKYVEELESLFSQMHCSFQEQTHGKHWDLEITMPQFICLKIVEKNDNCMMKELAEKLQLSLGTVTGIIDRLTKNDFVERYRDERDRRVVRVKLTEKGKNILVKATEKRKERFMNLLKEVDEADIKSLLESFRKLLSAMVSQREHNPRES
jgi:DNA-binding MarR family transcriptional regulator